MLTHFKKIIRWVLPFNCVLCLRISERAQDLCERCLHDLPTAQFRCQQCACVLHSATRSQCGFCLQTPPPFDRTLTLFTYLPPVVKLMLDMKFYHALTNTRIFGELLAEKILGEWYQNQALPAAIIPVPLHKKRLRERGFNQAVEIARPIARATGIPILLDGFRRCKATAAQTSLTGNNRSTNLRGAFEVLHPSKEKYVAVVDDVITTGSTIKEFCRTLRKSGVEKIDIWCCARAALR